MSTTKPQELMEMLAKLDEHRKDPPVEVQRRYQRFVVRGEAKLEPIDEMELEHPIPILLRDISRGGVGFLSNQFLEPCTMWRVRFATKDYVIGSQPIIIRFCRAVQSDLYLVGGQAVIEPYILGMLGVPANQLRHEDMCTFSDHDVSNFVPPGKLEED
ncbi:MAG: hypothetical protein GC162_16960 [Planctomycetes bacterium]|nr:hypothetical protein [Planctomycetota bacterium]